MAPLCVIYTHAKRSCTQVKDPAVRVRVSGNTEITEHAAKESVFERKEVGQAISTFSSVTLWSSNDLTKCLYMCLCVYTDIAWSKLTIHVDMPV